MKHDDMDDLDRALFALPLEEPPAGLRASILRSTIHAPALSLAPFGRVETVAIGVTLAIAVWLAIWTATTPHLAGAFEAPLGALVRMLSDLQNLVWLGVGVLTAAWLTIAGTLRLPFNNGRTS